MGKLVELAKISEELEANLNAIIENREATISVLRDQISLLEMRLKVANDQIKDQQDLIALLEEKNGG